MEQLFTIIGLALISAALCLLLKQYKPEYAMLVSLICGVVIFSMIIISLLPAFDTVKDLMKQSGVNSEYIQAMVKALGICYVTQLASDSCNDAGQTAIAGKVELCGKVFIVLLSLPLFQNLVQVALGLMKE